MKSFIIPNFQGLIESIEETSDKVVVISIIGKSAYSVLGQKVRGLEIMFNLSSNNTNEYSIEGSFDEENQIIYLNVRSMMDTDIFIEHYEELVKKYEQYHKTSDFLAVYNEIKSVFARILLLLFSVSHIVILSHPKPIFDVSYIQFLKAVDSLRMSICNSLTDTLKQVDGLPQEWVVNNRFCVPRLLFYFDSGFKGIQNIKKMEHNMEDRIYHILRKTRIIGNFGSSLFSIPLNEEFVFISTEEQVDKLGQAVKRLYVSCQQGRTMPIKPPFFSNPTPEHSIQALLQVHVQKARSKGFDDNVSSRHSQQPTYFLLPTVKQWTGACKVLYEVIIKPELLPTLCTDTKFSEQRCLKVLPIAMARYQEGLPSHYTKAVHEGRLAIALALFAAQARGSLFQKYSEQLITECQAYWESGRQLCEVASLTGNPCTLPKHSRGEHCSGVRYVASCDCGRKQCSREDPYTAQQANYDFYQMLSKECVCGTLDRINFPVFEPSTKEFKAATLAESEEHLSVHSEDRSQLTPGMEKSLVRQPSTTEYLPGMLTLSSPPGLLPTFSSWSLLCLGPSSLYSHNLGLSESQHPGFLNATNYLLPWDVTVTSKSRTSWPQMGKHPVRGRRPRMSGSLPQFTVKVFIGVEYECPRGHRFMLAAPDKVLRAAPGSIVKDTGHKIAESDMPLYFPCPCRSVKPLTAQLMRLHIVTPKAPVHCTLYPRVQPAAGSPIFIASADGPVIVTQSAYWVMRLPYVYASDKGSYTENITARLLAKVFAVTAIDD
ncbi:protein smg8 [Agrilus planipennis]|uniref:Nonsense-mediated mRNA decay factor SMG8 n=1 Tax=Agrilus planipennis TaxID=224129 RepID=A0A1W4W9L7_AGRPL|nr:protein smg8 [Agrilus planipennis]